MKPANPLDEQRRIALTTAVRDTDAIPKVAGAGDVIEHDSRRVQVMHNGVLIEEGCYGGDFMTEIIRRLRGHHEPQEELVFHTLVERLRRDTPNPVMIELGSYWAYYSLWLKHACRGATCVLVEPDQANAEVGIRNFELNGYEATVVNAAAGAQHGSIADLICESDGVRRALPVVSVDGLVADHGLDRIDLLLCDVQGAELAALHGAARAIAERRVRFVVVSTHHHRISGDPLIHQRCLASLEEAGAHIVAEHSPLESCSGDGLVAAAFRADDADLVVPISIVRSRDSLFGELEYDLAHASRWARKAVAAASRARATARRPMRAFRAAGKPR